MASLSGESWDCTLEAVKDLERLEVPELDGTLLMELLDESYADEAEDDKLTCVMRSLEAEISHADPMMMIGDGVSTTGPPDGSDDGGLEDILSDFDSYDDSRSPAYLVEDPFDLVDMEVGDGMGGWCMEAGMVVYGEPREYGGFYSGEGTMEQAYSPLWQ